MWARHCGSSRGPAASKVRASYWSAPAPGNNEKEDTTLTRIRLASDTDALSIEATSPMRNERNPVPRLLPPSLLAAPLLRLAPGGATLAQQAPTPAPLAV